MAEYKEDRRMIDLKPGERWVDVEGTHYALVLRPEARTPPEATNLVALVRPDFHLLPYYHSMAVSGTFDHGVVLDVHVRSTDPDVLAAYEALMLAFMETHAELNPASLSKGPTTIPVRMKVES